MTGSEAVIRLAAPPERDSIVNGPGLRAVIWTQGCRMHCPGCHNPETWAEDGGQLLPLDRVIQILAGFKGQTGLTFCGGEPLLQPEACLSIARWAKKERQWNIWIYTGYRYEDLAQNPDLKELLNLTDVLIDSPYIQAERDLSLTWRGSRNQRLIELKNGEIISIK